MALTAPSVLVPSAAQTASGVSAAQKSPQDQQSVLNLLVGVTAVAGTTPSMAITVQWSEDGGQTWADADPADTFSAITAVTALVKQFTVKAPTFRIAWTITGTTPSFTFAVSGNVS